MIFDPILLIKAAGYAGLFAIVFAESGLLVGFFLPGDSLLFTAGFLASQGYLDIRILSVLLFIAAVLGDNFGYLLGRVMGSRIFRRPDSFFFRRENAERAKMFFERHGRKTLVLARFIPVIRTFTPVIAGVGKMRYTTYLIFDTIGGVLWAVTLTFLGYFLGAAVPNIDTYVLPIILFVIIISLIPLTIAGIIRSRRQR